MNTRNLSTCFVAFAVMPAAFVLAQDPKALEVLRQADAATKRVKACSYEAEFSAEGQLAMRLPTIKGTFMARSARTGFVNRMFGANETRMPAIRAKLTISPSKGEKEPKSLDVASDGKIVTLCNLNERYWMTQNIGSGEVLLDAAKQLYMLEFFHPTPFSDELNGKVQTYEGVQEVGGVTCDVVYVVYQMAGLEARWYFGQEDHLPRRVDRVHKGLLSRGVRTLTISNLDIRPNFTAADFRPPCPREFEKRQLSEKWDSSLLKPGQMAPDWKLSTSDGGTITLSKLRGQVVVLDFWATWCTFCKMSLPETQKLHETYKDKPVRVIGICCWDPKGNPGEYIKSMKYTFETAVKGDQVAEKYLVTGLPTYYVIDAEGKIAFAGAGANQRESLSKAVEKAMKESGK